MKSVTIYTGPLCNFCDAAKKLLARNNVKYNEINIATVDGAMDEMIAKANGKRTIQVNILT
jgi:glutaredoxin 3